jgi:hypothetical protein
MNQSSIEKAFSSLSAFVSLILPFFQLGVVVATGNPFLFFDSRAVVPNSVITLVFSVIVVMLRHSFPFIHQPLDPKRQEKYLTYLNDTNPASHTQEEISRVPVVTPPIYLTHDLMALVIFIASVIAGYLYLSMGLTITEPTAQDVLKQSMLYSFFIVSVTYVIFHLLLKHLFFLSWKDNRATRIKRAIDLAIDHSALVDMPTINVKKCFETFGYPNYFVVHVTINSEEYQIATDTEARELVEVMPFNRQPSITSPTQVQSDDNQNGEK